MITAKEARENTYNSGIRDIKYIEQLIKTASECKRNEIGFNGLPQTDIELLESNGYTITFNVYKELPAEVYPDLGLIIARPCPHSISW